MKNYEKYAEEIRKYKGENFCKDFIIPNVLKSDNCGNMSCDACRMLQMIWLFEEPKEPEIDWSKVEVDTPILVRNSEDEDWYRRYFAEYKDGVVYTWVNGCTSWTAFNSSDVIKWKYAKLAESEDE